MLGFRRWLHGGNTWGVSTAPAAADAGAQAPRVGHFGGPPGVSPVVGLPAQSSQGNFNMVVIRLALGGAKKRPFYNIVVADARERRDGRFIERVGFYNPMAAGGEQPLRLALDRVTHWTGVGARLSPTVERLVDQARKAA
jgi:small subunit ribosomal protein S16